MATTEPIPPRLLAIRIRSRLDAPTMARLDVRAEDGECSFLVTREILEMIAKRCVEEAEKMPRASELS